MVAVRVVQISDTHLSGRRAYALDNVLAALRWIAAHPPDLVVHTGDLGADDPDDGEERLFAAEVLTEGLRGIPLVVVPGNHDVGGFSGAEEANDARIGAFRAHWGDDGFCRTHGGWRLVGIDCYRLVDPTYVADRRRAIASDLPIALFLHQPPYLEHPDLLDDGDWSLPERARTGLWTMIQARPVRFCASGHLHAWRVDGRRSPWLVHAPSAAFAGRGRPHPWRRPVGVVEHLLGPDGRHEHRIVIPPGTIPRDWESIAGGATSMRELPLLPAPLHAERTR